jgi:hypothetical protein
MGAEFGLALWRSEGMFYAPVAALEQLRGSHPGADTALEFGDTAELSGVDVEGIVNPEIEIARTILVRGWGPEGKDEAVLYIAREPDGALYWYGVLAALGGFDGGATNFEG